jgi:4-oxalocrotonate tautomerase
MPYINLKILKEQVSEEIKQQLVDGLIEIVTVIMHRNKDLTVITVDEMEAKNWFIGNEPMTRNKGNHGNVCFVSIKISKGTSNPKEMSDVITSGKSLINKVLGNNELTNYFIIEELNPDGWGFDGISMTVRNQMEK